MLRVSRKARRQGRLDFARTCLSLLDRSWADQQEDRNGDCYRRFVVEWPLFRKVGDWVAENGQQPEWSHLCTNYPAAVRRFGWAFSPWRSHLDADLIRWCRAALDASEQCGDEERKGEQLLALGILHIERNECFEAILCLEQALENFHARGDRRSEASALLSLGRAHSGRVAGPTRPEGVRTALRFYEETVAAFDELGERRSQGATLMELGQFFRDIGQMERSVECFEQALMLAGDSSGPEFRPMVLFDLACLHRDLGAVRTAVRRCDEILALFRQRLRQAHAQKERSQGDLGVIPGATEDRALRGYRYEGTIYFLHNGELDGECCRAECCCHEPEVDRGPRLPDLGVAVVDPRYAGVFLLNLGCFYADLGAVRRAVSLFYEARDILRAAGDQEGAKMAEHNLNRSLDGSCDLVDGFGPFPPESLDSCVSADRAKATSRIPPLAELLPLLEPDEVPGIQSLLASEKAGSDRLINLEGVRLLRLGKVEEALGVFRSLVVGPGLCLRSDLPDCYLTNFATALLLDRNIDGCTRVLAELRNRNQSTGRSDELERCIRQWERSLSWGDRLKRSILGIVKPVHLPFRPGQFVPEDR